MARLPLLPAVRSFSRALQASLASFFSEWSVAITQ
jgi:hypothetical protein